MHIGVLSEWVHGAYRSQKRTSDALRLKLQTLRVLELESGSSARVASVLNPLAISPAPVKTLNRKLYVNSTHSSSSLLFSQTLNINCVTDSRAHYSALLCATIQSQALAPNRAGLESWAHAHGCMRDGGTERSYSNCWGGRNPPEKNWYHVHTAISAVPSLHSNL